MTSATAGRPPFLRGGANAAPAGLARIWTFSGLSGRQIVGRMLFLTMTLSMLVITTLAVVSAVTWIGRPFAGFLVNERMVLGNIGQYDWTGTRAGLKWPDRIVKADAQPVRSMRDLDRIVQGKPIGDPITYTVQRRTGTVDVAIRSMRFTWADFVLTFGITCLAGLLYFSIGALVFLMKPGTRASWALLLSCVFLGVFSITSFDIQSTHAGFIRIYLLVNAFFPAAFLHLSLVFPERRRLLDAHPSLQVAPYIVSALLTIPVELLYPHPSFLVVYQFIRSYAILSALAILGSTIQAFAASSSVLAAQRAKVVLLGVGLAFPLPAVVYYLSLFGSHLVDFTIQNNFLALPITIFPASIAYAIVKHNLFDVDVYIRRAVGYGVMTTIVGLTYFGIQSFTSSVLLEPIFGASAEKLYPVVFAALVVFLFNPVNRKTQDVVDRVFFRRAFDYKATISAVSTALTSMLNLEQIIRQVVQTVREEMFIDTAGMIVMDARQRTSHAFFLADRPNEETPAEPAQHRIAYDDPLLALLREQKTLLTRYDIEEDPRYQDVRDVYLGSFSSVDASLAIPVIYQDEVRAVLTLGQKKSGQFYSTEDIQLLNTMAAQAAVAIENATTHEQVVRYADELAASLRRIQILESIKTNLAKFVPKTVQELIEESPEAPSLDKREVDVSVLFADITGYTRLSAQMELDEVNRLVERYFGAFLDEILRHGGDVNETAGDGLMVIFQHRDPAQHARAAAQTALAIRRRTLEINEQHRGQYEPITMHVGVNSGIAAVGATRIEGVAGTRWTYTASGSTTNVAARLAALSEGGALIISEETRRRLGDGFTVEDLGLQSLKNVATPMRAYRVLGGPEEEAVRSEERRRHARHPVPWQVRLWAGEESYVGSVLDASPYGLCLGMVPPTVLKPGQSCRLEILIQGEPGVPCLGEVRYVTDRGVGIETRDPLPLR
jgi:class 3 adenylate cyclase